MGHRACLHSLLCGIRGLLSRAVRGMRQLAALGDPAALGAAVSTVPWATCSAVRALYASLFMTSRAPATPPGPFALDTLHAALVRDLVKPLNPKPQEG